MRAALERLGRHLSGCGWQVRVGADVPDETDLAVVWTRSVTAPGLAAFVAARRRPSCSPGLSAGAWPEEHDLLEAVGVLPGAVTPLHESGCGRARSPGEVWRRFDGDVLLTDQWQVLDKVADDVDVVLTAAMGLQNHPVATTRGRLGLLSAGAPSPTLNDRSYARLVHRLGRAALGLRDAAPVRVGLLGYGAIGHEHAPRYALSKASSWQRCATPTPTASTRRRPVAPDIAAHADGAAMLDADVDLVIVSTPPDSHVSWALRA